MDYTCIYYPCRMDTLLTSDDMKREKSNQYKQSIMKGLNYITISVHYTRLTRYASCIVCVCVGGGGGGGASKYITSMSDESHISNTLPYTPPPSPHTAVIS